MIDDKIIQEILGKKPEITKEQVRLELEAERSKTGDLIAEETLLRLIAARHGVEISRRTDTDCRLEIRHLVPSLNKVTLTGRVVAVYPVKTFEGAKPGKYASLIIADSHGLLRVMLWNGKADLVETSTIRVGQVVRFSRAYTRADRNGKTELHISEKADVEIRPNGISTEDYPYIERFVVSIKDLKEEQLGVHLKGKVKAFSPKSTFFRVDNSAGTFLRFTLTDKTGDVVVNAWNNKAEQLEPLLRINVEVTLVNAKVKSSNGCFEVHVDEFTYVEILTANDSTS